MAVALPLAIQPPNHPDYYESDTTHPTCEVKQGQVGSVLAWGTSRKSRCCFFFAVYLGAGCSWCSWACSSISILMKIRCVSINLFIEHDFSACHISHVAYWTNPDHLKWIHSASICPWLCIWWCSMHGHEGLRWPSYCENPWYIFTTSAHSGYPMPHRLTMLY